MKKLIILVFIIFLQLSFANGKLTAGLFKITPYAYKENNKIVGITPEIIEKLSLKSNLEIETILLPYKRMLHYLESGKIDFAIFFLSDYSQSFSTSILPLYNLDTIAIGRKGFYISEYEDLYDISLVTARGVKYNLKDKDKPLNIHYVKNYKDAILMLNIGRVDAIIAPQKILSHRLAELGMNIKDLGEPFLITRNTAWIQFSNKSNKQEYKNTLLKSRKRVA